MASTPASDAAHGPVEPSGTQAISRRPGRGRRVSTATSWPAAGQRRDERPPEEARPAGDDDAHGPIVTRRPGRRDRTRLHRRLRLCLTLAPGAIAGCD